MIQSIHSIEKYYQSVLQSITSNAIQDISHKKIKQCREKLNGLNLNKHLLNSAEAEKISYLSGKFKIIDQQFQYAINNYVPKSEFEEKLKRALGEGKESRVQQNQNFLEFVKSSGEKSKEEGHVRKSSASQNLISTAKQRQKQINYSTNSINPQLSSNYLKPSKLAQVNNFRKKEKREPTYRQDQIVRKQKLIQDLLRENMRLKDRQRQQFQKDGKLPQNINKSREMSRIEQYIYTNKLLVKENRQIQSKLHKLEEVVEALLQQNKQEQIKQSTLNSLPSRKTQKEILKTSKKSDTEIKDLFPMSIMSEKQKHKQGIFNENEFLEYYIERDGLQRKRNTIPKLISQSNDLKYAKINPTNTQQLLSDTKPIPESPILHTYFQSVRFDQPTSRVQTSHARSGNLSNQNLFPGLLKYQSEVLEPDLRQYILPKQKQTSNVSMFEEELDESELEMQRQSSLRESIEFKKRSIVEVENQNENISFDTFQEASSRNSSEHDDYILIESRQNTRIQNTPKISSITKQNLMRNKIAFFKKSLVIIKDEMSIEIGFKRSELNREMDCLRVSLYITNKLETQQPVDITYEYDRKCYQISINYKAEFLKPNSTVQQDITVYYKGQIPMTFILVKVQLEDTLYQLVLPILFFIFKQGLHHLDQSETKTITIFPQKQFSSPRFMHSILPLRYVNEHEEVEYRRGQKSYIAECTLKSKMTLQGLKIEWISSLIKLTCDKGFVDMLAWILADVQP